MKLFFIVVSIIFSLCFTENVYAENIALDSGILDNLEKNYASQEVYDYAYEIFSTQKVNISETQEEINFKAKAIKEIFDLDVEFPEREYELLNCIIKNDLYRDPDATKLLNNVSKNFLFGFPYYILKKNPKISLKDINNTIQILDCDSVITNEALELIIKNDKLVLVDNIFSNESITKVSELNNYAIERNSIIPIEDELLKEFIEYAKQNPTKSAMVDKALRENNVEMYETVLADIQATKLAKLEAEKEQKRRENREYSKKCFLSPEEHMTNFFRYDQRSNSAFAVGLLNPINLIGTVVLIPVYIMLSPFSGLH